MNPQARVDDRQARAAGCLGNLQRLVHRRGAFADPNRQDRLDTGSIGAAQNLVAVGRSLGIKVEVGVGVGQRHRVVFRLLHGGDRKRAYASLPALCLSFRSEAEESASVLALAVACSFVVIPQGSEGICFCTCTCRCLFFLLSFRSAAEESAVASSDSSRKPFTNQRRTSTPSYPHPSAPHNTSPFPPPHSAPCAASRTQ